MAPSYVHSNDIVADLKDATHGYDYVFNDDIIKAREILSARNSPFHQMGLGTVIFMQAALGMEEGFMAEATKLLTQADAAVKQALKNHPRKSSTRFPAGLEFEVLQADLVLLVGLTQALGESYMGYVKCLYSLNSAHGSFSKIFKRVFPKGLDGHSAFARSPAPSRKPSTTSLRTQGSTKSTLGVPAATKSGFFSRFSLSTPSSPVPTPTHSGSNTPTFMEPEGPLEDMIFYGAAYGFGMFNLIFSMMPNKIRKVIGFFGYQSDRKAGLEALQVAAMGKVYMITLLTYQGIKLLMTGYQADEAALIEQLDGLLSPLEAQYPNGSLWLLNRAKLLRYQNNPSAAITVLESALSPTRTVKFVQADALIVFELGWLLVSQRRYAESAEMWQRMKDINSWSHTTYIYMAAGCLLTVGTPESHAKARALYDSIPSLKKDIQGRDLPTELYINRKLSFWKRKQARWAAQGRNTDHYADCIRLNPAEEFALFWNTHNRIPKVTAEAHIEDFLALTPAVSIPTPYSAEAAPLSPGIMPDLDTPDELVSRDLLLGVTHRAAGEFGPARAFLTSAAETRAIQDDKWVSAVAYYELGVLDLREVAVLEKQQGSSPSSRGTLKRKWEAAIASALARMDQATANLGDTDLSSRLESRIAMLRDELDLKKTMIQ